MFNSELKGKNALVTGAGRGIGRAIAVALAQAGVNVAVNYNKSEKQAQELVAELTGYGVRALCMKADVSRAADAQQLVEDAQKGLGSIDILVNNAGIGTYQSIEETTEEEWDNTINANLKSVFLMVRTVWPGMSERKWGRIINLSSIAAQLGGRSGPQYAASKAGVIGITHYYSNQLISKGITVNAICPGPIETDLFLSGPAFNPQNVPAGRVGKPEEVGQLVLMLAGNGFITGQTININGGMYNS